MCGGGGDQTVTQRTELDPELRRLLYGGALTSAHGLTDPNAPSQTDTLSSSFMSSGGGGGAMWSDGMTPAQISQHQADRTFGNTSGGQISPQQAYDRQMASYQNAGGGLSVGHGSTPAGAMRDAGFAVGGPVQSGIASMQPNMPMTQNMPMMNGMLPNLSDPEIAATLAMAQMRPQMMMGMGSGGMPQQAFATGGYVEGPGTGTSDDIPATIYQDGMPVQNAALSDGEFVMTERAVRGAGGGDRDRGAARMYEMMRMFEQGGRV